MKPNARASISITCNATSVNAALPTGGGRLLRVFNVGPQPAFIELSNDANSTCAVPTANGGGGLMVAANVSHQDVFVPVGATRIAAVSTGNSVLYVARGDSV